MCEEHEEHEEQEEHEEHEGWQMCGVKEVGLGALSASSNLWNFPPASNNNHNCPCRSMFKAMPSNT